ncbi:hypothetical protein [Amaricoccus solimangrovi]|uniref:Uncharacterized protein n=1 Tax=Amaricoccus solimangrovi TaxID=2589815 RepID=A0A501WE63_9RHOB|nr:hypothetical protein [Amaricoccus solimangrovi]TPE47879.1 hypothetical protein FJM51_19270 [Amaricoccus solimangrovi]
MSMWAILGRPPGSAARRFGIRSDEPEPIPINGAPARAALEPIDEAPAGRGLVLPPRFAEDAPHSVACRL